MRISTKGRFAINALIDLAARHHAGPVSLATVAQRQQVSLSYLEQLFAGLRNAGIVQSTRGPGGGYSLGRDAAAISVADVMLAVDDPQDAAAGSNPADHLTHALWLRLSAAMLQQMAGITLASLVVAPQAVASATRPAGVPRRALAPQRAVQVARPAVPNSVFAFGRSFAH